MKNTHDGEMRGLPPTGRTIALPGIDVIEADAEGIDSVRGYFSNSTLMEQLDCQVIMQPKRFGPVGFGNSTYTSTGNTAKPGVLGITQIQVTAPEKREEMRELTRAIIQEIALNARLHLDLHHNVGGRPWHDAERLGGYGICQGGGAGQGAWRGDEGAFRTQRHRRQRLDQLLDRGPDESTPVALHCLR